MSKQAVSPPFRQNKPIASMSKIEMEEKIKGYRFVLMKLHKEIEEKDEEIARLNILLTKAQRSKS